MSHGIWKAEKDDQNGRMAGLVAILAYSAVLGLVALWLLEQLTK